MAVPSQSSNAPLESWCDVCAPERYPLATLQAPDGTTISLERNSRWLPKLEIDEVRPRVELSTAASNLLQILKASSPADIGRELAIDKFGIPRLQSGLDNLLQAFPEESGVLAYRYERFAHKYLRRVLEELYSESGTRKKMPEGIFVGEQGRINARIVVGYNVEVRDGKALGYVRDHACSGEFGKDYFFQPSRKMRNLLDLVYDGSTVDAMVDYLRNHPRADWRRTFAGLRPEHFQAGERWTRKVVGASGGEEKREANVKGARDAMREYLKGRIGAPLHAQVLVADYLAGLEQVLGKLSRQDLDSAPSRHGGTFGNLRKVFGTLDGAIHDFIRFHPDERVREHFSTLRDYHLPGFRNSRLPNGEPNYALTREATEEWLYQLVQLGPEKGGITSLKTIPIELNLEKHLQVPLKHCGATLTSLLVTTYGSKLLGVIDCLIHLSDSAVRSFYQEVDYYHFQHTSKSAYRSAKKPQDTTGWIEVNGGTHRPWRNVGVVYRSFSEALDLLTKDTVGFFGLRRVFEDLQVQTLQETKSQYGGSLDRAYNLVFHGARDHRDRERDPNPRTLFNLVLGGYLWSKEFEQFYANRSDRFKNGVVRDIEQARRSLADVERPGNGIVVPPWANGKSVSWESSSWGIYFGLEDRHQSTIVEAHRSFTKRPRIHSA